MYDALAATATATGVVFLAELGDKTQLLAVNFGSRHSLPKVIAGLTLGYGAANLVAVAVGGLLGASLPQRPVEVVGGIVFVLFGIHALLSGDDHDDDGVGRAIFTSSVVATIGVAILLAEMGDKTQLATATLAARSNPIATWVGATIGEVASGMIGVVAGSLVGGRISDTVLRWVSVVLFVVFGVALLVGWP